MLYVNEVLKKIFIELKTFKQNLWTYVKFFIIVKSLLAFLLIPIYRVLMNHLIESTGEKALSSGNFKAVMMTTPGVLILIITFLFFLVYISLDINTSILVSSAIHNKDEKIKLLPILKEGLGSMNIFVSPAGFLIMLYIILIVPLVGIGLTVSAVKNFRIPNFITSVIFDNNFYFALYIGVLTVLTLMSFFSIFSFHYALLKKEKLTDSIKKSILLVSKHKKELLAHITFLTFGLVLFEFAITVLSNTALEAISSALPAGSFPSRFLMLSTLVLCIESIQIFILLFVPIEVHTLTAAFYEYTEESFSAPGSNFKSKENNRFKLLIVVFLLFIFNLSVSIIGTVYFDEFFYSKANIMIVAHRGGGDLGPENTIKGINAASKFGAEWSEIDVQRTKDEKYIINHDNTFERLTGNENSPGEMTLSRIKKLKVKDTFSPHRKWGKIPTLEETLDFSKGKIGLLVELKGKSADRKMADDVVKAISSRKMTKECVVISLNYKLIEYVKKKYPQIKTGYLYFFVFGDASRFNADYLIMEEDIVNENIVRRLHEDNKKVLAWTVNEEETVHRLAEAHVDGIITDNVKGIRKALDSEKKKNDIDIIMEELMSHF